MPRGHAEVVEEGHGVLGGDVARGAGGERRPTDAADAGVEPPDPTLQAGVEVHQTCGPGLVEVEADVEPR